MHNPESILENETQKIFRDFEKQMDHLISARRPGVNKKKRGTCRIEDFARSQSENYRKWKEK